MSSLNAFLHPAKIENKKVVISNRFMEAGKPVPFEIKAITEDENAALMKQCTRVDKKTGNELFDRSKHAHEIAVASVVFPDLTNADLQKAYGVVGADSLLKKMLTVGEFAALSEAISDISGLDIDLNEKIEETKN